LISKNNSEKSQALEIIPIGGCGEFGMNLTGYSYQGELIIVDCGIMFASQDKLGIDSIIPNIEFLIAKYGRPKAYVLTHGHEDHIGALPFVYKKWPAPLYCTAWTEKLITSKFERDGLSLPKIHITQPKDVTKIGKFSVEWVHVNHSIPMACSVFVECGGGNIFHTGDFKVDDSPLYEAPVDYKHLQSISKRGVDILICDSTNAHQKGRCPNEASVIDPLKKSIKEAPGRVFVTTFSSNYWRLLTLIKICQDLGKKIYFEGTGLKKTLGIASDLNLLPDTKNLLTDPKQVDNTPKENLVIVATGCQGEPLAAMARICRNEHRFISLHEDDIIIFSSRIIPGSEKSVFHLMSQCALVGSKAYTVKDDPSIHVSGHACEDDIKVLIDHLKPKNFIPVHGTFSHLKSNQQAAQNLGMSEKNTTFVHDGDVISHTPNQGVEISGEIETQWQFIDSYSKQVLMKQDLKARLKIGELGACSFSGVYSKASNKWLSKCAIKIIGLNAPEKEHWQQSCEDVCKRSITTSLQEKQHDVDVINEKLRIALRQHLYKFFKKKIVVIMSVHLL